MTACNNAYRPREPLRSKNMKVESRSVVPSRVLAHSGTKSGGKKARLDSGRGPVERRVELEPVADGLLVEADEQDPVIDVQADGEHP